MDDIWTNEVNPVLLELEEGFAEHGLVRELMRNLGTDIKSILSGSSIYITIGQFSSLGDLVAASGGLAAAGTQAAIKGAMNRRAANNSLNRNELFFLYEVDRRLKTNK